MDTEARVVTRVTEVMETIEAEALLRTTTTMVTADMEVMEGTRRASFPEPCIVQLIKRFVTFFFHLDHCC